MNLSRSCPAVLIGFLVAATVSFAAESGPADRPQACGHGTIASLSQDERLMLFVEMHQATAGMSKDQKRNYHRAQREKLAAMSPAEREKFAADLDAKWNALPADRQAKLKEKAEAARGKHPIMARMMGASC